MAVALVVVLVALLARELGAGASGQLVAAASAAVSGFVLVVGHLLSTATFDLLAWTTMSSSSRILGGDERTWLLVGLVMGVALQNKHLPLLLVLASPSGSRSSVAQSRCCARPGCGRVRRWPQLSGCRTSCGRRRTAGRSSSSPPTSARTRPESRATLLPLQFLFIRPTLVPLLRGGAGPCSATRRFGFGVRSGSRDPILLVVLLVLGGKPYYAAPLLLCLLAQEPWSSSAGLARRRGGFWSERRSCSTAPSRFRSRYRSSPRAPALDSDS